ncbi:MAG: YwbE family protein [Methanotrichaceae archaeon]|nr:YwbE family protein [Methanotrichaceae archaeon]
MNGQNLKDIRTGQTVDIVLKQNQRTGELTRGVIRDILTNSAHHPHGIKVRLQGGQVGRVKRIIEH